MFGGFTDYVLVIDEKWEDFVVVSTNSVRLGRAAKSRASVQRVEEA